jgi:hypothetical protein
VNIISKKVKKSKSLSQNGVKTLVVVINNVFKELIITFK